MVGGKAAGRAAEGIIAKAVKDLFRIVGKDAERAAARDAAKAAERDLAKGASRSLKDRARALLRKFLRGDPIDIATGTVVQRQVDVDLPGLLPLTLVRTHLSSYRQGGWFGASWASTLDQRLEVSAAEVRFLAEDGAVLTYVGAARLPQWGARWPLAETAGGYTVTDPERGRTLHFAQRFTGSGVLWPLAAITDRNGHRIDIEYGPDGAPAAVRHSGGYHIEVLTAGDRVTALRLRDPGAGPAGAAVELAGYRYDGAGRLAEVLNWSGQPARYEYDAEGRMTYWADRNGVWYRYGYDEQGRCVSGRHPEGYRDISLRYEERLTVVTDSLGHQTTFHLNDSGQVVREVDPLGRTTTSQWDEYDRLLARTDPLGRTTRYHYDDAGNQTMVVRPDGSQATATYNRLGRPVLLVDPDGGTYRQDFDGRGNLIGITDPLSATTRYSYDERGRLLAITDAAGNVRRFEANAAGLPVAVTDAAGATTRYARDAAGRIERITGPLGEVTRCGWSPGGQLGWRQRPDGAVERWRYDAEDNLVEYVDAAGHATRVEFAHFDLPVARTDPDGGRTEFGYDTELRLTSVTNPQGLRWRYEYDPAGQLVREVDVNGRELGYGYDTAGQLATRVNGAGELTSYVHDRLGNLVEERAGDLVRTYEHDAVGYLLRASGPEVELTFERDPLGRVLAETCDGQTVSSRYDAVGRRTWRRTPSGAETTWEYGPDEEPAALHTAGRSIRFGYDTSRREVARGIGGDLLLTRSWDAAGRLTAQTLTTQTLTAQTLGGGTPTRGAIRGTSYEYRPDGEVTAIGDDAGGRRFELDPAGRVTAVRGGPWLERYAYDPAGHLSAADWPAPGDAGQGAREYAGSLLRRAGNLRFEYDAQGRVTLRQQRLLTAGTRTWRFSWDAADRLTGVITPDGAHWRYRYDPLGRRIGKERLVAGAVAERVRFAWDGQVLAEQVSGERATVWNWAADGLRPLTRTGRVRAGQDWVDAEFHAVLTDLVGTPTDLVSMDGRIAWRGPTTVWGLPAGNGAGVDMPLRFPGQYFDTETGLNYNYHRYYDPATARYQSADPLGLDGGADPHGYVRNPCTGLDPLGLVSYKEIKEMMMSQKIAPDLLDKGVHFNVGKLELRAVPDHLGGVVFRAVHPGMVRGMEREFGAAAKKATEALANPEFVEWLGKHATKGFEMASERGSGKALEFKFLLKALGRL
jgi:RHS repeat-associated protein